MKKKSGREEYLDKEWKFENVSPPPDSLPLESKLNIPKKRKSGREEYEERVWDRIDKMSPPPPSWPLEKKLNIPRNRDVATGVATGVATKSKSREDLLSLRERLQNVEKKIRGPSLKKRLLCFMLKVRISLATQKMILELSRELGVNRSEAVRLSIAMCYMNIIKKEPILWQ